MYFILNKNTQSSLCYLQMKLYYVEHVQVSDIGRNKRVAIFAAKSVTKHKMLQFLPSAFNSLYQHQD